MQINLTLTVKEAAEELNKNYEERGLRPIYDVLIEMLEKVHGTEPVDDLLGLARSIYLVSCNFHYVTEEDSQGTVTYKPIPCVYPYHIYLDLIEIASKKYAERYRD